MPQYTLEGTQQLLRPVLFLGSITLHLLRIIYPGVYVEWISKSLFILPHMTNKHEIKYFKPKAI